VSTGAAAAVFAAAVFVFLHWPGGIGPQSLVAWEVSVGAGAFVGG
jgi:hypothetical protein